MFLQTLGLWIIACIHAYMSWGKCWFYYGFNTSLCIWIWILRPSTWKSASLYYYIVLMISVCDNCIIIIDHVICIVNNIVHNICIIVNRMTCYYYAIVYTRLHRDKLQYALSLSLYICIYIHVCMYIYIYMYRYTHVHVYMCVYIYIYTIMCIYIYIYIYT